MQLRTPGLGRAVALLAALVLAACAGDDPAQPDPAGAPPWDPGEVGALHNELLAEFYRLDHEAGHDRPRAETFARATSAVAERWGRPGLAVPRSGAEELAPRLRSAMQGLYEALSAEDPAVLERWFVGAGLSREVGWRILPARSRPLGRQVLRPYEELAGEDREQLERGLEVRAASGEFWRERMSPDRETRLGHRLDEQDAVMLADAIGAVAGGLAAGWLAPITGALASISMEEVIGEESEDPQPICTCSCTCDCCSGGGDDDSGG